MRRNYHHFIAFLVIVLMVVCSRDANISEGKLNQLTAKLATRDWEAASDSLAFIGKKAVQPLIELAQSNDASLDWPAARACYVLARIRSHEAIDVVSQIAQNQHASRRRRQYAIEALGLYNVKNKTDVLIKLLNEDDMSIADPAARSLGQIGTPAAVAALVDVLATRPDYVYDHDIRQALIKDHASIVAPIAVHSLNARRYWDWMSAMDGLAEMGGLALPTLIQNINHEDPLIRLRIIRILGKIGSDLAVTALLNALQDEDWMIRNEAAVSLVKIGSDKSIEQLKTLRRDPDLAHATDDISWVIERLAKTDDAF